MLIDTSGVLDFYSTTSTTKKPSCLLYTSDAADERSSVDLGGRRIIKKKQKVALSGHELNTHKK